MVNMLQLVAALLLALATGAHGQNTQPELLNFGLNIFPPERIVALVFNAPMQSSSCILSSLTLQNTSNIADGSSYTPQGGSCISINQSDLSFVSVVFSEQDWQNIDSNPYLFTGLTDSFISMAGDFIQGVNGLFASSIPSTAAFPVQFFHIDMAGGPGPMATSAVIDLNQGRLAITFDQPILTPNAAAMAVTSSFGRRQLSGFIGAEVMNNTVTADITPDDLNFIKVLLFQPQGSPGIELQANAVASTENVPNELHTVNLTVLPDNTSPTLFLFNLDMNNGIIALTFNEPISNASVDLATVLITNATEGGVSYNIGGIVLSGNAPYNTLNIELSDLTLNQLKSDTGVAISVATSFLSASSSSFQDLFSNLLTPLSVPIRTNQFIADSTPPMINSFNLDLDTGGTILTFSEPVDPSSFSSDSIFLTNTERVQSISLTGSANILSSFNTQVNIIAMTSTWNEIKLLRSNDPQQMIYLFLNPSAVSDTSSNAITSISIATPLLTTTLIPDTTPPEAESFLVIPQPPSNFSLGFQYSEYVNILSFDVSTLVLRLESTIGVQTFDNFAGGLISSLNPGTVVYEFSETDKNQPMLPIYYQAAYYSGNLSVSIGSNSITDLSGNQVLPIPSNAPLVFPSPGPDPVFPQLSSFILDLSGKLLLTFSEDIYITTPINSIVLQSSLLSPSTVITLSSTSYSQLAGTTGMVITVNLNQVDNNLIASSDIGNNVGSTFIQITSSFCVDYSGNRLLPASPLQASSVIEAPVEILQINETALDLDSGTLTLTFSSAVQLSTINTATGIALNNGITQILIMSVTITPVDPSNIVIPLKLLNSDLNEIKLAGVGQQWSLIVPSGVFTGENGAVNTNQTIVISSITVDTTPPIVAVSTLDLNLGQLQLSFNEPIELASLNLANIFITNTTVNMAPPEASINGGIATSSSTSSVTIHLTTLFLNSIKSISLIGTSTDNTYTFLTPGALTDLFGNTFPAPGISNQITNYIEDTILPQLISFNLDMNIGTMTMTFNEPISVDTLTNSSSVITAGAPPNPIINSVSLILTNPSVQQFDTVLTVSLSQSLNALKLLLAGQTSSAFINVSPNLVQDTSGNLVQSSSLQVNTVVGDTVQPTLLTVVPNQLPPYRISNQSISFTFSEAMLLSSLDESTLSIELETELDVMNFNHFSSGNWIVDLATASYFFSQADLNEQEFSILFLRASYISNMLISIEGQLGTDTSGNVLNNQESFPHSGPGGNDAPPTLTAFSLDLNTGFLALTFSEGVIVQQVTNNIAITNTPSSPTQSVLLTSSEYANQSGLLGSVVSVQLLPQDLSALISSNNLATSTANTFLQLQTVFALDFEENELSDAGAIQASSLTLPVILVTSAVPSATSSMSPVSTSSIPVLLTSSFSSSAIPQPIPTSSSEPTISTSVMITSSIQLMTPAMLSSAVSSVSSSTSSLTNVPSTTPQLPTSSIPPLPSSSFISLPSSSSLPPLSTPPPPSSSTPLLSTSSPSSSLTPSPSSSPSPTPTPTPQPPSPVLTAANLDLDNGQLSITFNMPVVSGSVQVGSFVFSNGATIYAISNSQVQGSIVNTNIVTISLATIDLNAIKFLILTSGTTWNIQLNMNAVTNEDGTGNQPQQFPLTSITPDTTVPLLNTFSLDLNSGRILLTFNEPINLATYNLQNVAIVGSTNAGQTGFNLQGSSVTTSFHSTNFDISIASSTLNMIKLDNAIGTSITNSYIQLGPMSFEDLSGNAIVSGPPQQAVAFIGDTISPQLTSFQLDLDSGILSMTFSEAVDVSSFNAAGIRITNSAQLQASTIVDYTLQSTTQNTVIELTLLSILNDLKLLIGSQQAFISLTSEVTTDTSNNPVIAIPNATPLAATAVIGDTTAPRIVSFLPSSPSENTMLTFTFNEYVSPPSWNEASMTIYLNTPLGDFTYTGINGGVVTSSVSTTVNYLFGSSYFQGLFAIRYQQAYFSGSISITFTSSLVRDVSGNLVVPQNTLLVYNSTTSDPVSPQLQSFSLDLNTGAMVLTFSEPVVVDIIPGNARIQSSPVNPSFTHTLTSSAYSSQQGTTGMIITLMLAQVDISGFNSNDNLANSIADTFLQLNPGFALDYSGNRLMALPSAVQATSVTVYTGPVQPHVLSFDLDLDSDQLTLQFDAPVQVNTFNPTAITLVNTSSISTSTVLVSLSNVTVIAQGEESSFRVLLSTSDIVNVKRHPVCYTTSNCYAVFQQGLVGTSNGQQSAAVTVPLAVSSLTLDVTPPRFLAFPVFDLNSGFFTLIFSEPINGSSTDFTQVTFSSSVTNPIESVTLTEGYTSPDHVEVDFNLRRNDLNALKYHLSLCTSRENCWVRLPSFFISDIGNNPFLHSNYLPNAAASFHQPSVFIADTTPPILESFDVDLNQGRLILSFNEVINHTTFTPSQITLLNRASGDISLVVHNDTMFFRVSNGTALELHFTIEDLNWLKARAIFSSTDDSFLSLIGALSDVSGNVFNDIHSSSPQQVATYIQDSTSPQVVEFNYFNVDNGTFYVTFDEPVNADSLVVTRIILVAGTSPSSSSFKLTGGTRKNLNDGKREVEIVLSQEDRAAIKLIPDLAITQFSTLLAMDTAAIMDTSGNNNSQVAVSSPFSLTPGGFVLDSSRAELVSVQLDMNQGQIRLLFSDVINAASIMPTQLVIQNSATSTDNSFTLTSSSLPWTTSSAVVQINLSIEDLNNLKKNLNLSTVTNNTFFSFTTLFATDIENRAVIPVSSNNATQVTVLTPDTTNPHLMAYSLDMDSGQLHFTFNEPVLISSVNPSILTFYNDANSPTDVSELTGGTASPATEDAPADTEMSVQMTYSDFNILKAKTSTATMLSNTYISLTSLFVRDATSNSLTPVTTLAPSAYEPDTTLPVLEYFDIDLTNGATLTMKFTEAVQFTNSLQSTISIRSSATGTATQFSLDSSESAFIASPLKDRINITLSTTHANRLSTDPVLGSSTSNTYLSMIAGGVYDYSDENAGLGQSIAPTLQRVNRIYRPCYDTSTYNNATLGTCNDCAAVCVGGCSGNGATAGQGGCNTCGVIVVGKNAIQVSCLATGSSCPSGFYSSSGSSYAGLASGGVLCQPCNENCALCSGPDSDNCNACNVAFLESGGVVSECLTGCGGNSSTGCQFCHSQCLGCSGSTNRDCVSCRHNSISTPQGTICVPPCSQNEYLADINGEYICLPCHSQCDGCTGPTSSDCKRCQQVNDTLNGNCATSCPSRSYLRNQRDCLPCHEQCSSCFGPTNTNCSDCIEASIMNAGGVVQCVPHCPIGQVYDDRSNSCNLTQAALLVSVIIPLVGAALIILLVLIVICYCWCCRKKGKSRSWATSGEPSFIKSTSF